MLSPAEILGSNGRIAARLQHRYEERGEQLQMAEAVAAAIKRRRHLIVEAGTGVGKSFAYLVPAILAAVGQIDSQPATKHAARRAAPRIRISIPNSTTAATTPAPTKNRLARALSSPPTRSRSRSN